MLKLINKNLVNGCANITGGGLVDNIKRVIPENLVAEINLNKINTSKIFKWLKMNGITDKEMLKTFNCGVGFCIIINPKNLNKVKKYFKKEDLTARLSSVLLPMVDKNKCTVTIYYHVTL